MSGTITMPHAMPHPRTEAGTSGAKTFELLPLFRSQQLIDGPLITGPLFMDLIPKDTNFLVEGCDFGLIQVLFLPKESQIAFLAEQLVLERLNVLKCAVRISGSLAF